MPVQNRPRIADERLDFREARPLLEGRLPGAAERRTEKGPALEILGKISGGELSVQRTERGERRRREGLEPEIDANLALVLLIESLPGLIAVRRAEDDIG